MHPAARLTDAEARMLISGAEESLGAQEEKEPQN
jgi:hypothetical protein